MVHFRVGSTQGIMHLHATVYQYLWIVPHVLLVPLALLMLFRGLYREFLIFFSYVVYEFLQFCVLGALFLSFRQHSNLISPQMYLKIDLFSRAGDIALHFGIIHELFVSPVAESAPLRRVATRIANWVTLLLVVLAAVFIAALYYNSVGHRLLPAYLTFEALNIAQCGLLVLVFLWYGFLRLSMSPFAFAIAVGMALIVGTEPLIHAWKDSLAMKNSDTPDLVYMACYHVSLLLWIYYALKHDKRLGGGTPLPPDFRDRAADLERVTRL